MYAGIYLFFGEHFAPLVAVNIVIGISIVALTIWLGRTFFNWNTGIMAGALMALWPSQIAYVTILASELPFTFFVLLGFMAWFSPRLPPVARGIGAGLGWAVAVYIRPIALLLPIVLLASSRSTGQPLQKQLVVSLVSVIVIALVISPWAARNSKLFGHLVLMSTNGGPTLWMGNNPDSDGFYMPLPPSVQGLNEYERGQMLGDKAIRYIKAEPVQFVLRTIKKAVLMHKGETIAIHWNEEGIKKRFGPDALFPLKLVTQGYWTVVLLLALVGFSLLIRERGLLYAFLHPVVVTWAYLTAVPAIFVVQDRYHFPAHPFISVLAAITIVWLARTIYAAARAGLSSSDS